MIWLADEEILMMDGGKRGRKVLVKGFEVDVTVGIAFGTMN